MNGDGYAREGGRHGGGTREYPPRGDREDRRDRDRGDRGDRNRRRSRSPQEYRGGSGARGPRREGGGEQDNYSSSRSHRDREREDRYSTRDRREREPWDRERGPRREPRRETDERRPQFNNAPRDGRHGVRRDRERGGDVDREKERQRSTTPPVKKREPTPDLTGVTSILERKRRMTQWDIKPPGYANVTAEQAKLSGMFPLPGAPRQQALDPTKMPTFMSQPGGGGGGGSSGVSNTVLRPTNSRQAKRLVVENLPPGTTDEELATFMNLQLNGLNVIESPDPCLACQVSVDKSFALAEFKSAPEATVALAFDGITMEADDQADENGASSGAGRGLTIRRPKDYIVPAIVDDAGYVPGVVSGMVIDTPNKLSVADIPTYLTDEQVTELLVSFGELKAFVLVKDRETEESRGVAFCEYVDPNSTDIALQGLNGMELGDKRLRVKKASIGITQVAGIEMGVNAMSMLAGTTSLESGVTRVLQLLNMVTPEELMDSDEYEEICDDVREECSKFGTIVDLKVPRPIGGSRQSPGVGKIFVKFDNTESATKALQALAGRKFADRTVVTTYFPEENFEVSAW